MLGAMVQSLTPIEHSIKIECSTPVISRKYIKRLCTVPHTLDRAYKSVSQQQREKTTIFDMSSHDNDQKVPDAVEEAETALEKETMSPPPPTNTPEAGEQTPEDTHTEYITNNEAEEAVIDGAEAAAAAASEANNHEEENWQ